MENLTWLVAPAVVALILGSAEIPAVVSGDFRLLLVASGILAAMLLAWAGGAAVVRAAAELPWLSVWRLAYPGAMLASAAALYMLLLEGRLARLGIGLVTLMLLSAFHRNLRMAVSDPAGERAKNLNNLSCLLDAVGGFLLVAFLLGIKVMVNMPVMLSLSIVGLIGAGIAYETLQRYGLVARPMRTLTGVFAVFSAELFAGISFLPTAAEVGAAIIVVVYAIVLNVAVRVMSGNYDSRAVRRLTTFALTLIAVILLTARWR